MRGKNSRLESGPRLGGGGPKSLAKLKAVLPKFMLFATVGGLCTGIQYLILVYLVSMHNWHATAASTLGFVASALVNYLLNYKITFRSKSPHVSALPRFLAISVIGLVLNGIVLQAGIAYTSVPYLWCQVTATVVVLFWNFVGSLKWSYAS
jgi:putative flippase GtrA